MDDIETGPRPNRNTRPTRFEEENVLLSRLGSYNYRVVVFSCAFCIYFVGYSLLYGRLDWTHPDFWTRELFCINLSIISAVFQIGYYVYRNEI